MFNTKALESYILSLTDEETLFRKYIPQFKAINKKFKAVGREESLPSAVITSYNNRLYYKDFGSSLKAMDVFSFLKFFFNLDYVDILNEVNDYEPKYVQSKNKISIYEETKSNIVFKLRPFKIKDKHYWEEYKVITKEVLRKYNVYPVEYADIIKERETFRIMPKLLYVYVLNDLRLKFYNPLNKRYKFFGNSNKYSIQGYDNIPTIGELLIITKSLKDVMVLNQLGYNSIAPNSETVLLPEMVMKDLNIRFKNILVLFDNDQTGVKNAELYKCIYNIKYFTIPDYKYKDISDYIKFNTVDSTKKLLEDLIKTTLYAY